MTPNDLFSDATSLMGGVGAAQWVYYCYVGTLSWWDWSGSGETKPHGNLPSGIFPTLQRKVSFPTISSACVPVCIVHTRWAWKKRFLVFICQTYKNVEVKIFSEYSVSYSENVQVTVDTIHDERLGQIYEPKALIEALQAEIVVHQAQDFVWVYMSTYSWITTGAPVQQKMPSVRNGPSIILHLQQNTSFVHKVD